MNKALFLDRDGVINKEKNYLYKIEDFEFIDGVFETCRYFQKLGYLLIVITNQAGIARGKYTQKDFDTLTHWMEDQFKKENILLTKVYSCPHHPDITGQCKCRKPQPGMILNAKNEFNIDMQNSILIGDKESDIEAGIAAGIKHNYLVRSGHPINEININSCKIIDSIKDLPNYH